MSRLHEASQGSSSSSGGATGDKAEATKIRAAITSIDPVKDFSRIPNIPCARSSLLIGMATAAGVTGISMVAGRGLRRGLNWGVGSFCFLSLASWESCRRNLKAEQMRMRTVIEGYKKSSRANKPSLSTMAEQESQQPLASSAASGSSSS
ncbi:hypothetical protein BCV70DRAFT_10049 [Testicularia cyperi]|uniref:Cytochrome c oxidase assembly protein COX20, mitochondrial n=1 Tax=Testicularia cyperi TaxID=1882483 RepID=A0A317XYQ0_9BASI|nr:hypothetical protein BCV70DRAFT_10049 [Testicularia cyperi]